MKTVLIGIPCLKVGGTEIQTLRLVEALVAGGYEVTTVCYFEYDFDMVQQFRGAGSKVECLSAFGTRPAGTKEQYRFLKKGLKRIVDEYHPDIAHIQYMAPGALPIIILKRLGVKCIIATSHTMGDIYKSTRLVNFLSKHILKAFTCITETAERSFFGSSHLYSKSTILKKHNHLTIYNTLSPNYTFTSRTPSSQPLRIGFVGRLENIKGADLLIPAFSLLKQQYPEATLTIVGDGKLHDTLVEQQKEFKVSVEMMGKQPYHKLPSLYQQMDIVWIPSRSEGFGLTCLEAMANGCHVVASQVGGLPEIVQDDTCLCQPESPDSLAEITCRIIASSPGESRVKRAQDFQFDNYKDLILSLYSKL